MKFKITVIITFAFIILAGWSNDWQENRRLGLLENQQRNQQLAMQTNVLLRLTQLENFGQINQQQVRRLLDDSWTNQAVLLRTLIAAQAGLPQGSIKNLLIQPTTNGWLILNEQQ